MSSYFRSPPQGEFNIYEKSPFRYSELKGFDIQEKVYKLKFKLKKSGRQYTARYILEDRTKSIEDVVKNAEGTNTNSYLQDDLDIDELLDLTEANDTLIRISNGAANSSTGSVQSPNASNALPQTELDKIKLMKEPLNTDKAKKWIANAYARFQLPDKSGGERRVLRDKLYTQNDVGMDEFLSQLAEEMKKSSYTENLTVKIGDEEYKIAASNEDSPTLLVRFTKVGDKFKTLKLKSLQPKRQRKTTVKTEPGEESTQVSQDEGNGSGIVKKKKIRRHISSSDEESDSEPITPADFASDGVTQAGTKETGRPPDEASAVSNSSQAGPAIAQSAPSPRNESQTDQNSDVEQQGIGPFVSSTPLPQTAAEKKFKATDDAKELFDAELSGVVDEQHKAVFLQYIKATSDIKRDQVRKIMAETKIPGEKMVTLLGKYKSVMASAEKFRKAIIAEFDFVQKQVSKRKIRVETNRIPGAGGVFTQKEIHFPNGGFPDNYSFTLKRTYFDDIVSNPEIRQRVLKFIDGDSSALFRKNGSSGQGSAVVSNAGPAAGNTNSSNGAAAVVSNQNNASLNGGATVDSTQPQVSVGQSGASSNGAAAVVSGQNNASSNGGAAIVSTQPQVSVGQNNASSENQPEAFDFNPTKTFGKGQGLFIILYEKGQSQSVRYAIAIRGNIIKFGSIVANYKMSKFKDIKIEQTGYHPKEFYALQLGDRRFFWDKDDGIVGEKKDNGVEFKQYRMKTNEDYAENFFLKKKAEGRLNKAGKAAAKVGFSGWLAYGTFINEGWTPWDSLIALFVPAIAAGAGYALTTPEQIVDVSEKVKSKFLALNFP